MDAIQLKPAVFHEKGLDFGFIAEAGPVVDFDEIGQVEKRGADVAAAADSGAEQTGVGRQQRRPGQVIHGRDGENFSQQPPTAVKPTPDGIAARLEASDQQPFGDGRQQKAGQNESGRNDEREQIEQMPGLMAVAQGQQKGDGSHQGRQQ